MKTKGFTLIELLATIAILMIILLIAVPRILDMIETARREAFRDTAYLITHTGKLFSAENPGDHEFYYIDSDEYNADGYFLDYSGTKPVTGIVLLNNNGKIAIALHNGTYCATKGGNETLVTITTVTPINCTVENIINTDKTWTEIATNWDMELDDLLDINDETDPDSPTEGLDIIIPVNVTGSTSSGTGDPETDSFTKTYYSMGYVTDEVSFPYSFDYTIELGVLPMDIADITSANVTAKSVFETLIDFKRYIVKRNMGEVIWPGADPVEIDINQASIFQAHANTSDNMTVDDVTVTCDAITCEANIEVTVNNITGIDLYNINGNDIAYTPLKFTVEFNGVEELGCPSNPQPESCFTFASGTISDYDEGTCGTDVVIPCTIGGVDVIAIADYAFENKGITSVIFPETLTSIGESAFTDNYLTSVNIPDNVTAIGEAAFYYSELSSVTLPSSLTTMTADSFGNNHITNLTIPNSVTYIDDYAFYENLLTSLVIPNNVTYIGDGAFSFNELSSLTLGSSVATVGYGSFENNSLTTVTIPNSVTYIDQWAFYENQLTSVILGNSIINIDKNAFCDNLLTSVTIPNSVTTIGLGAFSWNEIEDLTLSNNLTTIGAMAFQNNNLTEVSIPSSVNSIDYGAFNDNLLTGADAFVYARNGDGSINNTILMSYGGASRTNVTIPNTVTTIYNSAMSNNSLTSVTIPNSVTAINQNAFSNNALTSVDLPDNLVSLNGFNDNYLTAITIPSTVSAIGNYAFRGNQFTSISIPTNITNIGTYAFAQNESLTSVTIPSSVTSLGDYSFSSCYISSLSLSTGLISIGPNTFRDNNLTTITIPSSVTTIGGGAFSINYLTSITMNGTITSGIANYMLASNNYFRTTYYAGGAGTYTGTQSGTWAKQ